MRGREAGLVLLAAAVFFFLSGGAAMALGLKSPAFEHEGKIPRRFTCEGEDASPQLRWSGAPAGTVAFALIADDPDAPMGTWVHWVVYNIPAGVHEFAQGLPRSQKLGDGTCQGITDFQKVGYGGPCPPPGKPHRYFFKLYALDTALDLKGTATKEDLLAAMEGHILAQATLMGTYQR